VQQDPSTSPPSGPSRTAAWLGLFVPSLVGTLRAGYGPARLRDDVFGGLTAAVVALPLALAFGVASGAGAIAGLYGAIAVGFFAAVFGGTPAQVSGPTGPMTVVMGAVIASHATSLPEAFTIVMLGGLLQIAFGLLRVGKYVAYTPYSVVSGFMTGVGVIILILQALPLLGLPPSTRGVIGTLETLGHLGSAPIDGRALGLGVASIAALVFWPRRLGRWLPGPLAVLVLGTMLAATVLAGQPEIGAVPSGLPTLTTPVLHLADLPQMLQAAFVLALLGSIDTLLTSLIADSVTRTQHDSDKELVGQGIGNCLAGLIGGLPGAGATMRTVVNVRAGGRSPVSGALHALVLLGLALGLGPVVAHVPHAVLAAILMKVGWDIIDWRYLKRVKGIPREKLAVMTVTFLLTVFVDLITAVAVGIILASFVNSRWLAAEQLKGIKHSGDGEELPELSAEERALLRSAPGAVLVTLLHGSFSYASARELARRGSATDVKYRAVVYDLSQAGYIDPSAALAIDEIIELAQSRNQLLVVSGLQGHALRVLAGLGVLDRVPEEQRFEDRFAAIRFAVARCLATDPAPASR
jgi:sulfate permease, SulP family